jgi:hypothetical protein
MTQKAFHTVMIHSGGGWGFTTETNPKFTMSQMAAQRMVWSLYDTTSKAFLIDWQATKASPYEYFFDISLKSVKDISAILKKQNNLLIALAIRDKSSIHFLNIGTFCNMYPKTVIDVADREPKACEPVSIPVQQSLFSPNCGLQCLGSTRSQQKSRKLGTDASKSTGHRFAARKVSR